jgi:uncharacterized phage protein gp47/JayE
MITIPTRQELYEGILSDLETEFPVNIPVFGKVFLRALAAVQAGKLWLYYKTTARVQKNIFVDSCDSELVPRWGQVKLGRNPFAATQAKYRISVTGTVGATVPALSVWKSDDSSANPGKLYIVDTAVTLATNPDLVTVRALEAGDDSALEAGDTLTVTAPIALIDATGAVYDTVTEPQAVEDIEDYRDKTLQSFRLEPQGGARGDYRLWGLDAQGVKQIYPYTSDGNPNEVDVYVEATIDDSNDGKGTPGAAILNAVTEVMELDPDVTLDISERGRRPLGVFAVNVQAIAVKDISIEIADYTGLNAEKQLAIQNALVEAVNAVRPFIDGVDIEEERNDLLDINKIIAVILKATPGASFGTITLTVAASPVSTYTFDDGEIPFLDPADITFV